MGAKNREDDALPNGTVLFQKYNIVELLSSSGGTGFTYKAVNLKNNTVVALKEFFPDEYCKRGSDGLKLVQPERKEDREVFELSWKKFEEEAVLLRDNQSYGVLLKFYDVFEENQTLYYAMEYLDGVDLRHFLLSKGGSLSVEDTLKFFQPVFNSLVVLHKMGIWHRDISPDNIFVCKNGRVRLIDFGNAKSDKRGNSRVIDWAKNGYSPYEQFTSKLRQGPWTDVYSVAATIYYCLVGEDPINAKKRFEGDVLLTPSELGINISKRIEDAIMQAISIYPEERFQTMQDFRFALYGNDTCFGSTEPSVASDEHRKSVGRQIDKLAGTNSISVNPTEPQRKKVIKPFLLGLDGYYTNQRIEIKGTMYLGRNPQKCSIVFPAAEPGVSGVHCYIKWNYEKNTCTICDVGSTYGTRYLDGKPVYKQCEADICEGEGFTIGENNTFTVSLEEVEE